MADEEIKIGVGLEAKGAEKEGQKASDDFRKGFASRFKGMADEFLRRGFGKFQGTSNFYTPKGAWSNSKKIFEQYATGRKYAKEASESSDSAFENQKDMYRRMAADSSGKTTKAYHDSVERESFRDAFTRTQNEAMQAATNLWGNLTARINAARDSIKAYIINRRELNRVMKSGEKAADNDKSLALEDKGRKGSMWSSIKSAHTAFRDIYSFKGLKNFGRTFSKEYLKPGRSLLALMKDIKRNIMYKGIRQLASAVIRLAKEGLANLDQYSQHLGTPFHQNVLRLASSLLYLKNAFAALVGPIVNAINPAHERLTLERLMDTFAALANHIGAFFAAITGQNQFSAALKKTVIQTKQAAGKLKDILAFDELNRLSGDTGGGMSADEMFEEWGKGSIFEQLQATVLNGKWKELGIEVGKKFNKLIENIDSFEIGKKMGERIGSAISFLAGLVTTMDFGKLGASIAKQLNDMINKINWYDFGQLLGRKFTAVIDFLGKFILETDWGAVARAISDRLKGTLDHIAQWARSIDWSAVGEALFDRLCDFFENFDLGGVIIALANAIEALISGLFKFVGGFFTKFRDNVLTPLKNKIVNALPDWLCTFLGIDKSQYNIKVNIDVISNIPEKDRKFFEDLRTLMDEDASEFDKAMARMGTKNSTSSLASPFGALELKTSILASAKPGETVTINGKTYKKSSATTKAYASGGTVDKGQLFIANEAGPELVGNIGGKTTVTNQDQFTQGLIDANSMVVDAVLQVVKAVNNKSFDVYMDAQKVGKSVTTYQNNTARRYGV